MEQMCLALRLCRVQYSIQINFNDTSSSFSTCIVHSERKKSFDIFIHCLRFHKLVIPGCRLRCTCGQHNFSLNFCGFFSFLTFINEFSGVLWELDDTSSNVAICKHMHSLQLTRKIMLFRMRQFVRCVFELCPMSVYALLDKD